jgi:hypothetical protein
MSHRPAYNNHRLPGIFDTTLIALSFQVDKVLCCYRRLFEIDAKEIISGIIVTCNKISGFTT